MGSNLASVVVDDVDDDQEASLLVGLDAQDEPPLLVEPYRMLSSSTAGQLLEVECLVAPEVDFGLRCGEEPDFLPVGSTSDLVARCMVWGWS